MSEADFLAQINYFGEANILGFGFDNSGRKIFINGETFSLATNYISEIKSLVFDQQDTKFRPYKVVKPLDNIQTIFIADSSLIGKIGSRDING